MMCTIQKQSIHQCTHKPHICTLGHEQSSWYSYLLLETEHSLVLRIYQGRFSVPFCLSELVVGRGVLWEGIIWKKKMCPERMWYERVCHKMTMCTNLFVQLAFVVGRGMRYGFAIDVAMIEYVEIFEHVDDLRNIFGDQSLVVAWKEGKRGEWKRDVHMYIREDIRGCVRKVRTVCYERMCPKEPSRELYYERGESVLLEGMSCVMSWRVITNLHGSCIWDLRQSSATSSIPSSCIFPHYPPLSTK